MRFCLKRRWLLFLALGCGGLAGCGGLLQSDAPPLSHWWLDPVDLSGATSPDFAGHLVVQLSVVPGLDTDRILNLDEQARLNRYSGARWPDHLPELLGSLVARSLESAVNSPVRTGEHARQAECLLQLEVRRFYGRIDTAGVTRAVEIEIRGIEACGETTVPVSTLQRVTVETNRMHAIVSAFQQGLDRGLQEISGQLAAP